MSIPAHFYKYGIKILKEVIVNGNWLMDAVLISESHRTFLDKQSNEREWLVLRRKPSVAILVVDPNTDVFVFVEQVRPAIGEVALELIAGSMEKDDNPWAVARHELSEEGSFRGNKLGYIYGYYPSPGGTDELIHLFYATVDSSLIKDGLLTGVVEEGEDIRVRVFSLGDVLKMIESLQITDGKILMGVNWYLLNKHKL